MNNNKILFTLRNGQKSPTFLATADVHLAKKVYNEPELESDLRDNFSRLVDLAINMRVQYLVVAGDLFENNSAKPDTIGFVKQQVTKLAEQGIRLIGIAGDHDKPLKGERWYCISGILPVSIIPEFAGIDYFDYSTVETPDLIRLITENKDPEKVQWLILHCQFPQLFKLSEAKKLIDFNHLELFSNFPNLQGVIAGDLHFAPETKAYGVGYEAYVGYPGSLGQGDISEAAECKRVLYCDGTTLQELPFKQRRKMIRLDFRGELAETFDVSDYLALARKEEFRPVFHVTWDRESDPLRHKYRPLFDVAMIHEKQLKVGASLTDTDDCADRDEVSSELKVAKAIREACDSKDEDLIKFSIELISATDPKTVLDDFKAQFNL